MYREAQSGLDLVSGRPGASDHRRPHQPSNDSISSKSKLLLSNRPKLSFTPAANGSRWVEATRGFEQPHLLFLRWSLTSLWSICALLQHTLKCVFTYRAKRGSTELDLNISAKQPSLESVYFLFGAGCPSYRQTSPPASLTCTMTPTIPFK